MLQTRELFDAALDVRAVRFIFFIEIAKLSLQFSAKPAQAASPTIVSSDDSRVDQ